MAGSLKFQVRSLNVIAVATVTSVILLSGVVVSNADAQVPSSPTTDYQLTPFRLFYLAYQGYFKKDGIDGSNQAGSIDPEMLVQAAIKRHQLPEQAMLNKAYLHALNVILNGFNED
jgi:hypothetical protein